MTKHDPQLGDGVTLDIQALIDARMLVQANSGGGKSYAIRKLCEIVFGHAQIIILDVEGEFYTLREMYGFVLAGKGGDCPAEVASAPQLARMLLELGSSCIVDLYELGARRADFIAAFVGAIMEAPRALWHDLVIVIDEANKFCPEDSKERTKKRWDGKKWVPEGTAASAEAIVDLMTRGRKRGFCGVLATQRLAALDKNAAAECNNVLIGRCALDVDIDRARKRLGMKASDAQRYLPELPAGSFYALGAAFHVDWAAPGVVSKIQIGHVSTTHPKRGQKPPVPPPPATVKKVLGQLAAIPIVAAEEAKTVDELKAKIANLEQQCEAYKRDVEKVASPEFAELTKEARQDLGHKIAAAAKQRAEDEARRRKEWEALEDERDRANQAHDRVMAAYRTIEIELDNLGEVVREATHEAFKTVSAKITEITGRANEVMSVRRAVDERAHAKARVASPTTPHSELSAMETKILTALAQHGHLTKHELRVHTGYSASGKLSSSFARLVRDRYIGPVAGKMGITERGLAELGDYERLPTGAALREDLMRGTRLSDMEKKVLSALCEHHPVAIAKSLIRERTGYAASGKLSSSFARLVTMGYAVKASAGHLRASDVLF